MTPPGGTHADLQATIVILLRERLTSARYRVVGEVGCRFCVGSEPESVRAPDVAIIERDRLTPQYYDGVPLVAVEIVSPTDRWSAIEEKVGHWLAAGVGAVLVVDPERRVISQRTAAGLMTWAAMTDVVRVQPDPRPDDWTDIAATLTLWFD